ncbi:hypothetical protein WAK64_21820 [Bacillus spongiae]|uniref:Uncharacterized protein n=1 Tax=Bacillus spongiae TaxID=2683610 RepID=A0ABU8HKV7_9BACI
MITKKEKNHIEINRRFFGIFFILFMLSLLLASFLPHEKFNGVNTLFLFNIPLENQDGVNGIGVASLCLLFLSLFFLLKSLNQYKGRTIILVLIVFMLLPDYLFQTYQKTIARGVDAVSYKIERSRCTFEEAKEATLFAKCELPFENYSDEPVSFEVLFYETYPYEDEVKTVSLLNKDAPYEVTLKPNEDKTAMIETYINVLEEGEEMVNGSHNIVNIIIRSETKVREL